MSVSSGPYLSPVPFVNIQEVQVSFTPGVDEIAHSTTLGIISGGIAYSQTIGVQLSHQIPPTPASLGGEVPNREIKFGSIIYLTPNQLRAQNHHREFDTLIDTINNGSKTTPVETVVVKQFLLHTSDFQPTQVLLGPAQRGNRMYAHNYSQSIVVPSYTPTPGNTVRSLYLVAASFRQEPDGSIVLGNVTRQVILQDNKVPLTSDLYTLQSSMPQLYGQQGTIWPGSVHQNPADEVMAGIAHSSEEHPQVSVQTVPNVKVKDMRVLPYIDYLSPMYIPPGENRALVSNIELSRNKNGSAHGYFAFNKGEFISRNSALRGIMTNWVSLNNSIELKDIIIYHKKTSDTGKCGLGTDADYVRVTSLGSPSCRLLDLPISSNQLLHVGFEDQGVTHTEGGTVEYRAELLFVDKSVDVVRSLLAQLEVYLNAANNAATIPTSNWNNPVYEELITAYLETMNYIFGYTKFEGGQGWSKEYWYTNMMAMAYGRQEGDSERSRLVRAIAGFISRLGVLVKKAMISTVAPTSFKSRIYNTSHEALLRFEKVFGNKLKIQGPSNTGLSYIDDVVTRLSTFMPQITAANYASRVQWEVVKYQIGNTTAVEVNPYGAFTPLSVGFGHNNTIGGEAAWRALNISLDNQFLSYLNSRRQANAVPDNKNQLDTSSKRLFTLALDGISVDRLRIPLTMEVLTPGMVNPPTAPASDYLSPTSQFYVGNLLENPASGSEEAIWLANLASRYSLVGSTLILTLTNDALEDYEEPPSSLNNTDLLTGLLPYIKSEEGAAAPGDLTVWDNDAAALMINLGSIGQVEYLNNFRFPTDLTNPYWKQVDSRIFQDAQNGIPRLCRIRKLDTLPQTTISNLQPQASLFVLGAAVTKTPAVFEAPDISVSTITSTLTQIVSAGDEILYAKNITSNWAHEQIYPFNPDTAGANSARLRY